MITGQEAEESTKVALILGMKLCHQRQIRSQVRTYAARRSLLCYCRILLQWLYKAATLPRDESRFEL